MRIAASLDIARFSQIEVENLAVLSLRRYHRGLQVKKMRAEFLAKQQAQQKKSLADRASKDSDAQSETPASDRKEDLLHNAEQCD